jgi:arylsulfatase
MFMMDDVGWSDFGVYPGGGKALGHPSPNIDRVAKEGVTFTSWYGQSSCTAVVLHHRTDTDLLSTVHCRGTG